METGLNRPDTVEFIRIYLAAFYTLVAVFYTVRIVLVKRTTHKEVIFPGQYYSTSWWNHMVFRCFRITIWMACIVRLMLPSIDKYLGPFESLAYSEIMLLGVSLLTFGFVSIIVIHFRLGNEWRSGVDPDGPKVIITTGIYRYSRNPMFCHVAMAQIGFFLALPSVFTLLCLVVGLYTLNSQAKVEERHLLRLFPQEYPQYSTRVRRWL